MGDWKLKFFENQNVCIWSIGLILYPILGRKSQSRIHNPQYHTIGFNDLGCWAVLKPYLVICKSQFATIIRGPCLELLLDLLVDPYIRKIDIWTSDASDKIRADTCVWSTGLGWYDNLHNMKRRENVTWNYSNILKVISNQITVALFQFRL